MTCPNISLMYVFTRERGDSRPGEAHTDMGWETLLWSEDGSHWRTLKSDPAMTGSPMANKDSSLIAVNQPGAELFYSYKFLHSMNFMSSQSCCAPVHHV